MMVGYIGRIYWKAIGIRHAISRKLWEMVLLRVFLCFTTLVDHLNVIAYASQLQSTRPSAGPDPISMSVYTDELGSIG